MNNEYLGKICPYCKGRFTADDNIVKCSTCDMPHHRECWIENQGCTTFGCDGTIQSIEPYTEAADFEIEIFDDANSRIDECSATIHNSNNSSGFVISAAFCSKCGNKLEIDMRFCPKCGARTMNSRSQDDCISSPKQQDYSNYSNFNAPNSEVLDVQNNKGISVLCYLGLLLFIPLLYRPNSQFVRFHANQGLICFITGIVLSVVCIIPVIRIVGWILECVVLIWEIMGIVNCLNGQIKEVPVIGKYKILK